MLIFESILELFPDKNLAIVGSLWGAAVFWIAGMTAGYCRRRGFRVGDTRKIFHFIVFTNAALLRAMTSIGGVVAFGTTIFLGVAFAVWRGKDDLVFEALGRPTDAPKRELHVIVPLCATALGGVTAHFIGQSAAVVGILVGGWGDAVGEPVGIRWGKHRYQVKSLGGIPATRSWEGTAAVWTMSFLASWLGLSLVSDFSLAGIILASLVISTISAAVETVSPHGTDNFTVMVTAAGLAQLLIVIF